MSGIVESKPNINRAIRQAAQSNQFTIIGDGDHGDDGIRGYLFSPEMIENARASKVKHIFIEVDQTIQDVADRLHSGEITRAQFVADMNLRMTPFFTSSPQESQQWFGQMADMITFARDNGMKVHFADPGLPDLDTESISPELMTLMQDAIGNANGTDMQSIRDELERLVEQMPTERKNRMQPEVVKLFDSFMKQRLSDESLAEYVSSVAGEQKSMIIYGAGHDDLRDRLKSKGLEAYAIDVFRSGYPEDNRANQAAFFELDVVRIAEGPQSFIPQVQPKVSLSSDIKQGPR